MINHYPPSTGINQESSTMNHRNNHDIAGGAVPKELDIAKLKQEPDEGWLGNNNSNNNNNLWLTMADHA